MKRIIINYLDFSGKTCVLNIRESQIIEAKKIDVDGEKYLICHKADLPYEEFLSIVKEVQGEIKE